MKIIVKILFAAFCLAYATDCIGQKAKLANSVLWKIEGENLKLPSYLMGTIHLMCEEDFTISDKIKDALKASNDLVLEIDFADPEVMAEMQKSIMGDKKLTETLTEDEVATLDKVLKSKMNAGIENFDQFTLLTIYSIILNQSVTCPVKKMWEMELITLATYQGKDIHGLEGIADQSDFFSRAFPQDELIHQLSIMDEYSEVFDKMVSLYKEENVEALGELVSDPRFMNTNAQYWMLEYRNANWLKKMPEMMKEKSQFFAVGSAHLVGDYGLIPGLRKLGYTITPVKN